MKKLMALAIVSMFSLSAAAASACDGMKGHEKTSDTQAKNENGKADKGGSKAAPGNTKSPVTEGTTKS